MLTALISRSIILVFGTLYPAYRSYKAIRQKNLQEYLGCLRYWIVYACFVVFENTCDIFLSWAPFYYELKIVSVLFLLLPPGSTMIYKTFIQPTLREYEMEIDKFLAQTRQNGYTVFMRLGSSFIKYGSDMFINTALKGSSYFERRMSRSVSSHNIYHTIGDSAAVDSLAADYDVGQYEYMTNALSSQMKGYQNGKHHGMGQFIADCVAGRQDREWGDYGSECSDSDSDNPAPASHSQHHQSSRYNTPIMIRRSKPVGDYNTSNAAHLGTVTRSALRPANALNKHRTPAQASQQQTSVVQEQ